MFRTGDEYRDMAHEDKYRNVMSYEADGTNERNCIGHKLPKTRQDWEDKRQIIDVVCAPKYSLQ